MLLKKFDDHPDRLSDRKGHDLKRKLILDYRLSGPSWTNLMAWCYRVWKGEQLRYPEKPNPGPFSAIVHGATEIAANAEGSWSACERQLKAFRVVAGKVHQVWMDDAEVPTW